MTCAERMLRIRMMEKMQQMCDQNDNQIIKETDGTLKYIDKKGEVMIEAKTIRA